MWCQSRRIAWAMAVAVSLAGCANPDIYSGGKGSYPDRNEVPIAGNFQSSTQLKLQAAEHWRLAANDTADGLIRSFQSGGTCIPRNGCTALYLRRSCETTGCLPQKCDTRFNQVFFNEFLTALVSLGYQVSAVPAANATVVDIDVQAVTFSGNRPQYRYAGNAVEIGPGIWALRDETSLIDKDSNLALRTDGSDANWYRAQFAAGPTPRNELVITVSAMSQEKMYVARNTRVYYTSDADADLYSCSVATRPALPPAVEAQLAPLSGTKSWTIPVRGDCSDPRCADDLSRRR